MPRPTRIQFPEAVYHVTARGNSRRFIFLDDLDRRSFLDLLAAGRDRFHLQIIAFCLMTNHYHLLLRTRDANLAQALQWINSVYAMRFLRQHQQSGHLFQGRYHAVLVKDEAHWLHLSIYLHLNPVRAKLVTDPAQYPWSSYLDFTRARSRFDWLGRDEILAAYGADRAARMHNYRAACLAWAADRLKAGWRFRKSVEEPGKNIQSLAKAAGAGAAGRLFWGAVELAAELQRVARVFGVEVEELKQTRRHLPGRLALYYHLVQDCGMSVTQAASALGISPAAVSIGIRKFKARLSQDRALQDLVAQLS